MHKKNNDLYGIYEKLKKYKNRKGEATRQNIQK